MADPKIKYTFTGDSADAQAAIAKLEKKFDALEARIKAVATKSKDAGSGFDAMTKGAMGAAVAVTGIGSGMDLILKGIQAANAEWQDFVDRQAKAKDENLAFAASMTDLAAATSGGLPAAKERAARLSEKGNVKIESVPEGLNRLQAAKGILQTDKNVDDAFLAAANVARHKNETMVGLAETSLSITGQLRGTTAEQAIGWSKTAMENSRAASPADWNRNALPAILGANKINNTPIEYATAMNDAIGNAANDKTLKRTATAQLGLEMQLAKALPELPDTRSRVEAIQADTELRDAFLEGKKHKGKALPGLKTEFVGPDGEVLNMDGGMMAGEKRMFPAIKDMLTKGTPSADTLAKTFRDLPKLQDSKPLYDKWAAEMSEDPNMQVADRSMKLQNNAQGLRIRDTEGAIGSINREGFEDNMSASGIGWFERQRLQWGRFGREAILGQSSGDAGVNTLKAELSARSGQDMTEESKKQTAALDKLVTLMEKDKARPLNLNPGE